jgi:hypothetical protein
MTWIHCVFPFVLNVFWRGRGVLASAKESNIDRDGDPWTIWSKWENKWTTTVSSEKTISETILRRLTSYVCNFWVSGMGPEGGSSENEDMVVCLLGEPYSLVKMLRIVRSVLSIQLCWISPGEMEFKYMQAEAHQHLISLKLSGINILIRATWHTRLRDDGHYTSSTLIGGNGRAGPSSLHTTLEGPTEYVNARWI